MIDKTAIIKACGITSNTTSQGIEIFVGKKKRITLVKFDGGVRTLYPKGGEYVHSTHWGVELNQSYVENIMLNIARNIINDSINS